MYVEPSTKLYTVADLSHVWIYAQIFQNDVGRLKPGDTAQITVDSYPGRIFSGQIEEILPQVDMTTRTVRVRLAMANPGLKLKPGMFVNVDVKTSLGRQLVVPASAVFQSGTRQLALQDNELPLTFRVTISVIGRSAEYPPMASQYRHHRWLGNGVLQSCRHSDSADAFDRFPHNLNEKEKS